MNRKITLFALAGKCGFFGASGLSDSPAALSPSSDASATVPRPTPHSRKNQRRVRWGLYSAVSWCSGVIARLTADARTKSKMQPGCFDQIMSRVAFKQSLSVLRRLQFRQFGAGPASQRSDRGEQFLQVHYRSCQRCRRHQEIRMVGHALVLAREKLCCAAELWQFAANAAQELDQVAAFAGRFSGANTVKQSPRYIQKYFVFFNLRRVFEESPHHPQVGQEDRHALCDLLVGHGVGSVRGGSATLSSAGLV